ncbi:storkhead-box protein 1-like [Scleropages formosus]|uniref:Storkhead box 1 n=1 Tax=Scleropages formosus TaxID=113540 RepID=A0A0P7U4E3_SCLFO|nr:storkhead-box protein 1 [Scleropages formosus]KPP61971.1 storkhead-box protein 1-like [Scleropages formosus]
MSRALRTVQLSAASLALVLARSDGDLAARGAETTSGQDVFEDFKSQNLRSFWNKRLVKAVAAVFFQGWMENLVLLVRGDGGHLEVLREAWMRRALRAPRGFVIRAVGDLTPMQMSPIPQSQFIPLSEVLCSVISDMNAAHVTVNQEALINHMAKAHPGITIPTQDILYTTLGSLIKERKIYHTGEGYFVVTPQTYFITNSVAKDKYRWPTAEDDPLSPPPITYLVSNESCMDTTTEALAIAHCRSCSCFAPRPTPSVQGHQSISECTGRSLKWPCDTKPSVQHQSTSTAVDYQPSEISKSTTSRKEKDKPGRKFTLSLFRRNGGKKEKPKKEYATFSGQFPPEEWPVRDEDNLNNLPRDLEHAIIKRINPELTVDNLVRHTVMMKKLEERGADRGVDKGMSTEIVEYKQRHHSKVSKRSASKPTRSKRRGHPSRDNPRIKSGAIQCSVDPEADNLTHSCLRHDAVVDDRYSEACATKGSKDIYKKRIDNPFHGRIARDGVLRSSHRGHKKKEGTGQVSDQRQYVGHRSKSWDPCREKAVVKETGRSLTVGQGSCEGLDERELNFNSSLNGKNLKGCLGDSRGYPDSSTLRIEDKVKHLKEEKARSKTFCKERTEDGNEMTQVDVPDNRIIVGQTSEVESSVSRISNNYDGPTVSLSLPRVDVQRRLSVQQLDSSVEDSHRPDNLSTRTTESSFQLPEHGLWESDGFADDHTFYQRPVEDDACSSLCLHEDSMTDCSVVFQPGVAKCQTSRSVTGDWDNVSADGNSGGGQQESVLVMKQESSTWHQSSVVDVSLLTQSQGESGVAQVPHLLSSEPLASNPSQAGRADSAREGLHVASGTDSCTLTSWVRSQGVEESLRGLPEELSGGHKPSQEVPGAAGTRETVENHSSTGDSGIDSPRTQASLMSSGSEVLVGLRRRHFLQNLKQLHPQGGVLHPQGSLLRLTPVMNDRLQTTMTT